MMYMIAILALAALTHGNPAGNRVIGGENAGDGEMPYQVSLQQPSGDGYWHFCGGSLISDRWVMTAAHCYQSPDEVTITVYVGSNQKFTRGVRHDIVWFHQHPLWNSDKITHDYGLIELADPVVFSSKVGCIAIPSAEENDQTSYHGDGIISGWGYVQYNGPIGRPGDDVLPDNLQKATLNILSDGECYDAFPNNYESSSVLCAAAPVQGSGGCNGDSGGPFTQNGVLVGVVSYVMGYCNTDYPTGFAKVSSVHQWIYDVTGTTDLCKNPTS